MAKPLLLALQLSPGDAEAGWSLLRLIADLCPTGKYRDVDLLVSLRRDTELDMQAVRYAARAFDAVHTYRGSHLDPGWPSGPNSQATETIRWFDSQNRKRRWKYDAIFLFEADDTPLSRDWLEKIVAEWKACGEMVLGHVDHRAGQDHHCNGNAIFSQKFLELHPDFPTASRDLAWDYAWRSEVLLRAYASRLIFNDYRLGTDLNPLRDVDHLFGPRWNAAIPGETLQPAVIHGFKRFREGHQWVRERVLNAPVLATV